MAGLEEQLQAATAALIESRARVSEQATADASAAALQAKLDALTEQVTQKVNWRISF